MIYREIVHTCSNSEVARAAVKSIGGDFARDFVAEASRRELPSGVLAARLVREFADKADEVELQSVVAATHGSDQPILSGLRYILERGVRDNARKGGGNKTPPAWMIAAARSAA
jgi:hypothetical protein